MTKIRKFFGLGRKPRKKREGKQKIQLPENFIFGSTDQKVSEKDLSNSDSADERQKKKV